MVKMKNIPDTKTQVLIDTITLCFMSAMLNTVLPSTRAVCIDFDPNNKIVEVFVYHDGEYSLDIFEWYSIMDSDSTNQPWMWGDEDVNNGYFHPDKGFEVVFLKYPQPVPTEKHLTTIYHRVEPFEDPK